MSRETSIAQQKDVGFGEGRVKPLLAIVGVIVLTGLFFLAVDRFFAEWMPDGEIVIFALGLLILSRFFSQRERYLRQYGDRAYRTAFWRFCVPGLGIVGGCLAHLAYIAGPDIPAVWWRPWLIGIGWFVLAAGLLLGWRTIDTMGLETLMMRYVYQPAGGPRQESGLYSVIRHPLYSAGIHIAFGLAFIHASWYALLVAILIPLFVYGWVRLVEERELMQRFPDYADYRRRVPAFLPLTPANEIRLWRVLLGI